MTTTSAARPLPRTPVLQQLRPTPRIYLFMGWTFLGAVALGGKELARFRYVNDTFSTEWGIGLVAAVSAVTLAIVSLGVGRIIDRRDPRPFWVAFVLFGALGYAAVGVWLLIGPLPIWVILAGAAWDGASLGLIGVASLKVQAAFVRPGAEGAAEILNYLRLGIGGVLGALIAGLLPTPGITLLMGSALLLVAVAGGWWAMRPVPPRLPVSTSESATPLLAYLRGAPTLRRVVTIDLVLALVIPTQFVNIALSSFHATDVASLGIAAGMFGVLLGRIALTLVGFRGSPRAILIITLLAFCALQLLGALSLTDGWVFQQRLLLPTIIILGTIAVTYAQGLLAAANQQLVAEDHRGSLGALLVTGRNVLIAVGALAGALISASTSSQVLLVILAASLLVVVLATGGFRGLRGI